MAWSFGFNPSDLDILNWNYKIKPNMDFKNETHLYRDDMEATPSPITPRSTATGPFGRPSFQGSQIDMSTGLRSQSRGYSFAQEENGVAMRRMQSNLSGALPLESPGERKSRGTAILRSIRHPLRRKQPPGE
jgi:hypothetical protein